MGKLALATQSYAELNRIPKRCPIAMSHQYCGPACEGEGRTTVLIENLRAELGTMKADRLAGRSLSYLEVFGCWV